MRRQASNGFRPRPRSCDAQLKDLQTRLAGHEAAALASARRAVPVGRSPRRRSLEGWDAAGPEARSPRAIVARARPHRDSVMRTGAGVARRGPFRGHDVRRRSALKSMVARFGGKGGGRPDLAQGGGLTDRPEDVAGPARTRQVYRNPDLRVIGRGARFPYLPPVMATSDRPLPAPDRGPDRPRPFSSAGSAARPRRRTIPSAVADARRTDRFRVVERLRQQRNRRRGVLVHDPEVGRGYAAHPSSGSGIASSRSGSTSLGRPGRPEPQLADRAQRLAPHDGCRCRAPTRSGAKALWAP